jgi:hypothetical protein
VRGPGDIFGERYPHTLPITPLYPRLHKKVATNASMTMNRSVRGMAMLMHPSSTPAMQNVSVADGGGALASGKMVRCGMGRRCGAHAASNEGGSCLRTS